MNRIAEKLIEFGMNFEYENNGSEGEKIISHQALLEVTRQNEFKTYLEGRGLNDLKEGELKRQLTKFMETERDYYIGGDEMSVDDFFKKYTDE